MEDIPAPGPLLFNPYLPFGGSFCTSIAQRQSYAIITMAKVVDAKAQIVAMLDDFLLVVPKLSTETGADNLRRGKQAGINWDTLLK